jgi:hypothetical protein
MPPFKTIHQMNKFPNETIEWYLAEHFGEGEFLVTMSYSRRIETVWHGFITMIGWQQFKPEVRQGTW